MSSDETPNVPTSRHAREAVREKAQQVHAKQSRARVVRGVIVGLVAVAAVGAAGIGIASAVSSTMNKPELIPSNMQDDGVVVHQLSAAATKKATADASPTEGADAGAVSPSPASTASPVEIHVYVDYLSSNAGDFERTNARQIESWIGQGAATLVYHPIALLTANSNGTKYSLRAAAAAACVANFDPDKFYTYNHELLTDQPAVDTDGKSDAQLADLAQAIGIEDIKGVRSCIEDKHYTEWVKDATARAAKGPLPGSVDLPLNAAPTVVVNGQAYMGAMDDPGEFSQFVFSVSSDAYYGTPTPTRSPSPTATVPAS
ncbi:MULTISPECIES: DsbA family protein [Bacteria]|uniref:DsbA family protein n=1 Tax=Bacteria TaxID=2 RepID=UPI003C7DB269